jgi:hypothetical protein
MPSGSSLFPVSEGETRKKYQELSRNGLYAIYTISMISLVELAMGIW